MYEIKITDELGFLHNVKCENEKELIKTVNCWLKNIDETPIDKIEIDIE